MNVKIDNRLTRDEFLYFVKEYITKDPECAPLVTDFIQAGISSALSRTKERAADMETALYSVITETKNGRKYNSLVAEKIIKWRNESSINWSWFNGECEKPINPYPKRKKIR